MGLTTVKIVAAVGIAVTLFAVSLIVIHVPVRTLAIFFGIGGTLIGIWLYIDYRQNKPYQLKEMCKCNNCDHRNELTCVDMHCPCCTIEKNGRYDHGVSTLT